MEVTGIPPPLWPQMTTFTPRRRPPSPIFSLPVLIILFPILALLLLFLVVPPFLSVTAQILSPLCVRKSWDTLNVFLVLVAIICGVLAKRNDGDETSNSNGNDIRNDSNGDSSKASGHHVSKQWFEHPERKTYDGSAPINARPSPAKSVRRLKRSSSSYPDMRQDSLWVNNEDRYRFLDDFEINKYRSSTSYDDQVHELRRTLRSGVEESEAKVIPVDTFVLRSSPLSTPPPPPSARHKPRRTYQAIGQKYHKVMNQNDRVEITEIKSPSVTPPPPPRRPPSPLIQAGNRSEQKHGKSERRKSNATKEIKMVFASLRKRKKKHNSKDHGHQQDCPLHSPTEPPPHNSTTIRPTSPAPPPPPPPPPPSSVFQKYNLFRKGSKSKKIRSLPTPPPPPPPPPPAFSFSNRSSKKNTHIPPTPPPAPPLATFYTTRLSKQKSQTPPPEPSRKRTTSNNGRPPLPTKANTTSYYDENVNSGGQSPLIPMPPPPPPFKMPDFKLVIRGDFVKIRSSPNSRCSSPDMEELEVSSSKDEAETANMMEGDDGVGLGVAGGPVYCPSPDVNVKAETFIARLRDGWKLEKINSMKEQRMI